MHRLGYTGHSVVRHMEKYYDKSTTVRLTVLRSPRPGSTGHSEDGTDHLARHMGDYQDKSLNSSLQSVDQTPCHDSGPLLNG